MQNRKYLNANKKNIIMKITTCINTRQIFKAWSSSVVNKIKENKSNEENNSPGLLRGSGWMSLILKKTQILLASRLQSKHINFSIPFYHRFN